MSPDIPNIKPKSTWEPQKNHRTINFIYACLQIFSYFYCRFIDDIVLLWNGSETQLLDFITRLNSRHPTMKFDFKYSKPSIEFLDTKIYKNKEKNKLLTTIYRKPTGRRNFLDPTSAHPRSWSNNVPLSQALRLKKISEILELNKHLNELKESFINRGYKEHFLTYQFNRISEVTRQALLSSKRKKANKPRIPLVLKFNRTLPNIKEIIDEHRHLLQINPKLKNSFQEKPIIAYNRNRNLKERIGSNKILNNKVIRKKKAEKKHLFCSPCYTRRYNLCCLQVEKTNIFKSYETEKT